ncbi:MAG: ABC transporter ATP-binding protein [Planctomycetes bacterium]|nr:ABC transporter ATP-binding protein [Planctomycetota bacterium]
MGASGSGKSTLLHLLGGLIEPTTGSVSIAGQDLGALDDRRLTLFRRRHLGLVFQAYNLVPTLTVEDNVQLPLLMERHGRLQPEKCAALLEMLGLATRRRHRPDQLSGGEQQRVAIARALIHDPSLLLADEPTGNLDSGNRERFCSRLQELAAAQRCTVVLATHDPVVAMWSDRVLLLRDGHLMAVLDRREFTSPAALGARFHELLDAATPSGAAP